MTWNLYRDGISYSSLSSFLVCRERFYIYKFEKLISSAFNYNMCYGTAFTRMIESAGNKNQSHIHILLDYIESLNNTHIAHTEDIDKLAYISENQYKRYVNFYADDPLRIKKHELSFKRTHATTNIPIIGSIDGVATIDGNVWALETKCRGKYDELEVEDTLHQNLQTMIYMLMAYDDLKHYGEPLGVVLNLVRRPNSDPYIIQRKGRGKAKTGAETPKQFYDRILADMDSKPGKLKDKVSGPEHYFTRFYVEITKEDLHEFNRLHLTKYLWQLKLWYDWFLKDQKLLPNEDLDVRLVSARRHLNPYHFQFPIGVFHGPSQGFKDNYWHYITSGSRQGLKLDDRKRN